MAKKKYPRELTLKDGSKVTVRRMEKGDTKAIQQFANNLLPDDLLFLRNDITKKDGVDEWARNEESGRTNSVLAFVGDELVGYALVNTNPARWTRRVGELRVNIAPSRRGTGLGGALTGEIFDVAREAGLRKLSAQMTPDQAGARAVFEHLGFQVEALLADWVEDRNGRTRDLLVMTHDLDGLTDTVAEPVRV